MEYKNGLTAQSTKVNGTKIKPKETVLSGMLKATYTLVNSELIKQMVMESIRMSMAAGMKVSGSMMYKKDKERKSGLMELNMLENILME